MEGLEAFSGGHCTCFNVCECGYACVFFWGEGGGVFQWFIWGPSDLFPSLARKMTRSVRLDHERRRVVPACAVPFLAFCDEVC